MRKGRDWLLAIAAMGAVGVPILIRAGVVPRGVRGEWEWPRQALGSDAIPLLLAGLGVFAFAGFAAIGTHRLRGEPGRGREARWLAGLVVASVAAQVAAMSGAPTGFGLTKWVTLSLNGASGYFTVAKAQMRDPWRFWAAYPEWIKGQDALHIGTHPPGLFLASRGLLGAMEASPAASRWIGDHLPATVDEGFRSIVGPTTRAERAAVVLMGALTLLACAATVVPLYLAARAALPASASWAAAALWPLVPSAVLFQPTADTAFPLLATSAIALAAWGGTGRAVVSGVVLGIGMQFSLAFLAVGLAVAIVEVWQPGGDGKRAVRAILATGAGFVGFTGLVWWISAANPLVIWWWNQRNHGRFYVEYPRSYLAWVVANPIELAVAAGLPAMLLAAAGFASRAVPRSAWAGLIVLALLNLSGKNASEVARLWLPFVPTLLIASSAGLSRLGAGPGTLGATVALVGLQTILLQMVVQVVYPF